MRVCVVIPTFNSASLTADTVSKILKQSLTPDIIIIDGGSSKNDAKELRKIYGTNPRVKIYRYEEDLGGAGSYHEGAKIAVNEGYDYIIFADNDAYPLQENMIEELVSTVKRNKRIGLCSPENIFWRPVKKPRKKIVQSKFTCFYATVPRKVLEEVGYHDKRFFIWKDDVDFALRVREAGYAVCIRTDLFAWHPVNPFFTPFSSRFYYGWRNLLFIARKHGFKFHYTRFPVRIPIEIARVYLFSVQCGSNEPVRVMKEGISDFFRGKMGKRVVKVNRKNIKTADLKTLLKRGGIVLAYLAFSRFLKEKYPGLIHVSIFIGFVFLFIGTVVVSFDYDIWHLLFGQSSFLIGEPNTRHLKGYLSDGFAIP